jgi:pilus assembly protein Flp/PilA
MRNTLPRFIANEAGTTAIEYGVIAACVAVVIVAAMHSIGTRLNTTFAQIESGLRGEVLVVRYYEEFPPGGAPRMGQVIPPPPAPDRVERPAVEHP